MDKCLEVRRRDGPADRREVILMVEHCDKSVQRMISGVSDLSIYQEDLLMHLERCEPPVGFSVGEFVIPRNYQRSTQFLACTGMRGQD